MQGYVFRQQKVTELLKKVLTEHIEGQVYDPVKGSKVRKAVSAAVTMEEYFPQQASTQLYQPPVPVQQAKQLAEDLMQRMNPLGFDRHKLIIQVSSL